MRPQRPGGPSLAMAGTRGVPAHYGGFETCMEEVGVRLAQRGHQVRVYCRRPEGRAGRLPAAHRGMQLVHLPALRRRTMETLSHTALSIAHLLVRPVDVVGVFNAADAPLLPIVRARGIPVATHVDGLEWKRVKWGPCGQAYYRRAEALAVRHSDALIADAPGIQDYYAARFGAASTLVPYGAPVVGRVGDPARFSAYDLRTGGYHLVVARFEPENHVDVIVEGAR